MMTPKLEIKGTNGILIITPAGVSLSRNMHRVVSAGRENVEYDFSNLEGVQLSSKGSKLLQHHIRLNVDTSAEELSYMKASADVNTLLYLAKDSEKFKQAKTLIDKGISGDDITADIIEFEDCRSEAMRNANQADSTNKSALIGLQVIVLLCSFLIPPTGILTILAIWGLKWWQKKTRLIVSAVLVAWMTFFFISAASTSTQGKSGIKQALEVPSNISYIVQEDSDASFGNRVRRLAHVYSNAATYPERKVVLKSVARQLAEKHDADAVVVFLQQLKETWGDGRIVGKVTYAPDQRGWTGEDESPSWNFEISDRKSLTKQEEVILTRWEGYKEAFRRSDGALAEPELIQFIADEIGLTDKEVKEALNNSSMLSFTIFK